jgi:tight adherence protein B
MALFRKNNFVEREDGLVDYDYYNMSKKEQLLYTIFAAIVMFGVGFIFYKSVILSAVLMLTGLFFPGIMTKRIIEKRKAYLVLQFKDMLYSLSSALSAGNSFEMALKAALKDLHIIYPNDNTEIIMELEYIIRGIEMNETVETMFLQFAERAHIEDIDNFVDILVTCKRMGGDLNQVIRSTSNTIGEKIEIKQEITTMIAGKKFEFNVLMVLPIVMVFLLSYTAEDYMEPVFSTIAGRLVMTLAIGIFVIAYFVGSKITKINI